MKCVAIALSSFALLLVLFEGAISFPVKVRWTPGWLKKHLLKSRTQPLKFNLPILSFCLPMLSTSPSVSPTPLIASFDRRCGSFGHLSAPSQPL